MEITTKVFGYTKDNEEVKLFSLKNQYLHIEIITFGGIIKSLYAPDKDGNMENLVLGMDNIKDYEDRSPHFGAIIGRIAGRISDGDFFFQGNHYPLIKNNHGINTLHSGLKNFSKRNWFGKEFQTEDSVGVELTLFSPHMDEGFPGNVDFTVKYTLKNNSIILEYNATPDRPTYLNLTNHSYFNLSGDCKRDINDNILQLNANEFTLVDQYTIPIKLKDVTNTPFDFRNSRKISDTLLSNDPQIAIVGNGIDHGFIIDKKYHGKVGSLTDTISGRTMTIETDQNIVVIYTGNYLDKIGKIANNTVAQNHLSICFETQDYTDIFRFAPDQVTVYDQNKNYYQKTIYTFGLN
ncbi:aldose epimerase family protein [Fusobacterium sp. PH5-44]|uniref:aldose epimerase family protein n=1 Tax=unclassified Fusobacterium TaxID=2648384 RepID=UPI003D237CF3